MKGKRTYKSFTSISIVSLVLLMAMLASMVGCGGTAETVTATKTEVETSTETEVETATTTATVTAPTFDWPDSLTWLGPQVEQAQYAMAAALAPFLEGYSGMKISVVSINEDAARQEMMKNGEAQLQIMGMVAMAKYLQVYPGFETRDGGPFQVRTVWPSGYYGTALVVRGDSDIETWQDIKPGISRPSIPSIPAIEGGFAAYEAWLNLSPDDIVLFPVNTPPATMDVVVDGRADWTIAPPNMAYVFEADAGPYGLRYLEMDPAKDPEAAQRFLEVSPLYGFAPNVRGPEASLGVIMPVSYNDLETSADTDPELIYQIAKWLGENYDLYKDQYDMFEMWSVDNWRPFLDSTYLPVHEGTVRYLKEIGIWTEADDARQEYSINLLDMYIDAYAAAIAEADASGIEVDPTNEEWASLWVEYQNELPPFSSNPVLE
jgi:TRAP-type uncharacterized transport system substrate-binding protein